MLISYEHVFFLIFWTLISTKEIDEHDQSKLIVVPIQSISTVNYSIDCSDDCSMDYCLKNIFFNKNCTKLKRDPCDCCNVCRRNENEICGGKFHIYGICEDDFICYQTNPIEQKGICVRACEKYQCLAINKNNKTICECSTRRVPCEKKYHLETCENRTNYLKTSTNDIIDCSKIHCPNSRKNSSLCPSDSHFIEDHTPLLRSSYPYSLNLSSICCETRGHCVCLTCPKRICGENSIMQISRIGNRNLPGQCCDQYQCLTTSKQCHHDKNFYNENETWSLDQCTTCTCRSGLVDCTMIQCPTYSHCGYMYKPENECCPKCEGCLNDRLHVQHMNSTWIESNGCMRCYCENGRSRCLAEGCIAPPCENPRQITNVCCPVCDDDEQYEEDYSQEKDLIISPTCPSLDHCLLVCEHGLTKDENGCFQCACSTMSCPSPLCTLKFDPFSKQYCLCLPPSGSNCKQLHCEKHCPYNYSIDAKTGCPQCACNPCPQLICTKNCTYGLKRNEVGCPICVCQSNLTLTTDFVLHTWNRQCQSDSSSYSNGEIWFDGCRQCFCHKGEQLCALISCPIPKCSQPVFLSNRCCPSCPNMPLLPEPIPSSQVCYASQYVTGEELEFDKCTKCICLHNIAFCSMSLCPPLSCSIPIYDSSLCCPICPPTSDSSAVLDLSNTDEDVCLLADGSLKHAGELWKNNDCQSCLCPRGGSGQIECYSQMCEQNLPCSNPVLKKGQCCPFCLPATAAVAVCIFNYIQYRSGEHWNVSECHHCECLLGTIVCHQSKCPILTCVHTVTLPGHCCPICRDQFAFFQHPNKLPIPVSRFGSSILILFSILILILILVILILLYCLIRGGHRSFTSPNQIANHSPSISHQQTTINSKISYGYNFILRSNELNTLPVNHLPRTSTHSNLETTSSNNELERITFDENDTLILQCSTTSSNDDDYQHELNSTDNDESHPTKFQMITPTSTFIYV